MLPDGELNLLLLALLRSGEKLLIGPEGELGPEIRKREYSELAAPDEGPLGVPRKLLPCMEPSSGPHNTYSYFKKIMY